MRSSPLVRRKTQIKKLVPQYPLKKCVASVITCFSIPFHHSPTYRTRILIFLCSERMMWNRLCTGKKDWEGEGELMTKMLNDHKPLATKSQLHSRCEMTSERLSRATDSSLYKLASVSRYEISCIILFCWLKSFFSFLFWFSYAPSCTLILSG